MKVSLAFVLSACFLCVEIAGGARGFNFDTQIGVVDTNHQKELCLNILNAGLTEGSPISIVLTDRPQSVVKAVVVKKLEGSCSRNPDTHPEASFYSLRLLRKGLKPVEPVDLNPPSIAIIAPTRPVGVVGGKASADLDGDGRKEYFRSCTSTEGIHLTVWSGRPLIGKRKWHTYYYLGYDVVPSCDKRDFQD
jgi:hypothetical protein